MKVLGILIVVLSLTLPASGQSEEGRKALQKVFDVLTADSAQIVGKPLENLTNQAWEALSYMDDDGEPDLSDLREAVPDYYNFREGGQLLIKLINPNNHNEYSDEIGVSYEIGKRKSILIKDQKTGDLRDEWRILYLDSRYLALEIGELRLFFTHTPAQE